MVSLIMVSDILEIKDKDWNKKILQSSKPVFVMFYSPTCPNCHTIKPYFDQYSDEFKDKVLFASMNVFENQKTASLYHILGVPTFYFICNGKPVNSIVGAVYPSLLKKTIEDGFQFGEDCRKKTTWLDSGITGYS